jgi:short-subunit dehydrogenase involved in D-alanine esterification of teichoic acids
LQAVPNACLQTTHVDLGKIADIAVDLLKRFPKLDMLTNNVGVIGTTLLQ